MKAVSDEDYILWKSAEWDVSEEEARRIIEEKKQKDEEYKSYFTATIDNKVKILF